MYDLRALYQEVIIDHNRHPRNYRKLADATRSADGYNPLCGDKLTLYLKLDGERISDVSFEGEGCAISVASASLMTEALKGKTVAEAQGLFDRFRRVVMDEGGSSPDSPALGKLEVLAGVKEFPARVKCATLCWHTLAAALHNDAAAATTE